MKKIILDFASEVRQQLRRNNTLRTLNGNLTDIDKNVISTLNPTNALITTFDATNTKDGSVIYFSGRTSVNDGGGGVFTYSSTSTATVDNGIVFSPTGGGRLLRGGWTSVGYNGAVNVKWFGAKGDGTTDDTVAIQAAIDYCAALVAGGTVIADTPGAYYSVSVLQSKSKVTFLVPNRNTTFISERGVTWDTQKCWTLGGFHGNDYDSPIAYTLNTIAYGNNTITLTNIADSSNFITSDIVFIESTTGSSFSNGGGQYENMPAFCQMNVVESSASGVLTLRHPIHENRSNAQIRRFSRTGLTTLGGSTPIEAVRDFKLLGGTWIASAGKQFCADGGIIDSEISPDVIIASGGFYGNCFAHITAHIGELRTTSIPVALALGAHNTVCEIGIIQVKNSSTLNKVIEFSESARDNTVRIGSISLSGNIDNGIEFVGSRRNFCEIDSFRAASITSGAIYFWSPEYVENYPGGAPTNVNVEYLKSEYNTGIIRSCYANSVAVGAVFSDTINTSAKYNKSEVHFSNVVPVDYDSGSSGSSTIKITDPSFFVFKNLEFDYTSYGVTSASPLSKTITIPAGTLRPGTGNPGINLDKFILSFKGIHTGTSGTRSLSVTFAGTTVYSVTLPNLSAQGIDIEILFLFSNSTTITATVSSMIEGTLNINDVGITGLSPNTTAYDLVISSTVSGGDVISLREFSLKCNRKHQG